MKRIGFIALGAVYATLGFLAIHLAWTRARHVGGFPAAFRYLLEQSYGTPALAAIAIGLAAFTLARLTDTFDGKNSAFARLIAFVDAIGHAALGWLAVAGLLHVRRHTEIRSALAWALEQPYGATLLLVAGVVVIGIGAAQIFQGATGRLARQPSPQRMGRTSTRIALRVGRFGYTTRGVVTAMIGWFLVRVAIERDPRSYHGIGGALGVLQSMRFGGVLLAVAGAGLVAYGGYLVVVGLFGKKL
jgi:hypothetical protein